MKFILLDILLDEVFIKLFCFEKFMLIKDEFRKKIFIKFKKIKKLKLFLIV